MTSPPPDPMSSHSDAPPVRRSSGDVWGLGVVDAASLILDRTLSPVELVAAVLERIDDQDGTIEAWCVVDGDRALAAARELETVLAAGGAPGDLVGAVVGVKDVIDVAGLPTRAGSPGFLREPHEDAAAVAALRRSGASILGKLHTAEFASTGPPPTRNPWNPAHTPGGSSSGSAAAVAAGMANLALGTQTAGSTLRPAAYCGVVAMKPTHGAISCEGVVPLAWSLDHVGIFARTVGDLAVALPRIAGVAAARVPQRQHLRLGVPAAYFREWAAAHTWQSFERTLERLERAGAQIDEVAVPHLQTAATDLSIILRAEMAAFHLDHAGEFGAYGAAFEAHLATSSQVRAAEYVLATRRRPGVSNSISDALAEFDAVVTPTTPDTAPLGLASTGDARFQLPWSHSGVPAVTIPTDLDAAGLPIGLQLVASRGQDLDLLKTAAWCEQVIQFDERPPGW